MLNIQSLSVLAHVSSCCCEPGFNDSE